MTLVHTANLSGILDYLASNADIVGSQNNTFGGFGVRVTTTLISGLRGKTVTYVGLTQQTRSGIGGVHSKQVSGVGVTRQTS